METFKFDLFGIFEGDQNCFEVKDASDANGFKMPIEISLSLTLHPNINK